MASFEKLSKGLEALKMSISSGSLVEDSGLRSKSKVSLCIQVTDAICTSESKASPNFSNHLSGSMETLFLLCDDPDANVRMVADECLNRIIRSLMDGHLAKVNVELHAELKRNRNARSLRAALTKFGELASTIRPNKRKVFMQSLVGLIMSIAKRQEESVLETLSTSLGKFLMPLGCFLLDNETKELLQVFMRNIGSENTVLRRTAASSILAICLNCSKPQVFFVHTINTLLENVLPVKEDQNVYMILGVLNCIRGLLGHLGDQSTEAGLRGSFGQKRKQKKESVLSVDSMIQVFELCLHWSHHQDHNVITAALETLNELFASPPPHLLPILLSQQGLSRSRIHPSSIGWKLSTKTLSDISVSTTQIHSEDQSLLDSEDLLPQPRGLLSGWLGDTSGSGSLGSISTFDKIGPPSSHQDSFIDYPDSESVMSDDFGPPYGAKSVTSATPENDLDYSRESPSPPPDSFHLLPWDIGELIDINQPPLLYTARRLVTAFLVPECGGVRVSVRSLALNCLSHVVKLSPSTFFKQIDKNGLSTPKGFSHICDVLCFANHSDQQLRGLIRVVVGNLIHSLFEQANYGPEFSHDLNDKNVSLDDLVKTLSSGFLDESSVCVRFTLSALSLCLTDLIESSHFAVADGILDKLLTVFNNPYWLVKVKLIELLCSLPFLSVYHIKGNLDFQNKFFSLLVRKCLGSEDNRVRKATCENLVKIVKSFYFPIDFGVDDAVVVHGINLTFKVFDGIFKEGREGYEIITERVLSRVINSLVEAMMLSASKHLTLGCIEALCVLSEEYLPSFFPISWQSIENQSYEVNPSGGLFSIVVELLNSSPFSLDLECHQCLLKLASNLFTGFLPYITHEKFSSESSVLKTSVDGLLVHCMRLMFIFSRVLDDQSPSRSFLTSPLKKRTPRPTSPSKGHPTSEKEGEKEVKVGLIGSFSNNNHYNKLLGAVRSGFSNYKLTLDKGASEKFLSLIRKVLMCLELILSPNKIVNSEGIFEELLQYLRIVFLLDSEGSVKVVYQLLRSLFATNLLGYKLPSSSNVPSQHNQLLTTGFYDNVVQKPLVLLKEGLEFFKNTPEERKEEKEEKEKTPLSQSEREILASRIKLFEGIVIQSLKEYTLTCNVGLQSQVLKLLTLLVQLKVNYCLLDSDHVFINFVLKQFEYLEAGQIREAEILIPSIFSFLVYLSNEKNHSKPVISMPKIIQLCDGLMASGQNPITHSIPALLPLVEHVFFKTRSTVDQKELETQKEYLLSMLLRLAEYPKVLKTVQNLMLSGRKWMEHFSRWYQLTLEALFPLLSEGRLVIVDLGILHSIFALDRNHMAPLSSILSLLFSPQQEGQTLSQWLSTVTVMLLSVSIHVEEEILAQLEEMNLYVREEGDDPLKVRTVSKTLPPQCLLAKLILRILYNSSSKLKQLILVSYKDESVSELEKTFSYFLLCCVTMFKPGKFVRVHKALKDLFLKSSAEIRRLHECFTVSSLVSQIPTLLWLQIMSIFDLEIQSFSSPFMPVVLEGLSLNNSFLRRGAIMINAEYLASRPDDLNLLQWFVSNYIEEIIWHCHEPPLEKLLTNIYDSVTRSKILLNSFYKCTRKMEPVFVHRFLHTLEYIHTDLSGFVLKLVVLALVKYSNIAIARLAATFSCRTVEFLLRSDKSLVQQQLSADDLLHIFSNLSSNQRLLKRHKNLIILLNKLGKQHYDILLCEFEDCVKPVTPESVKKIHLDKSWFFNLVKEKCSTSSDCDIQKCAYLLNKLDYSEVEKIMFFKDFNLKILEHCFSVDSSSLPEDTVSHDNPVSICARKIILKQVEVLVLSLHSKDEVFDPFQHSYYSKNFIQHLSSVIPALNKFLGSIDCNHVNFEPFNKEDSGNLSRFGVICAEVVNWIIFQIPNEELKAWPSLVQDLLECSAAIFQVDCVSNLLSYEQILSVSSSIISLLKFVTGDEIPLKEFKSEGEGFSNEADIIIVRTAIQMISVISFLERNSKETPDFIFHSARSLIISLGRNQKLHWLCRIPIEAWTSPLHSPTPPSIPPHLLHDADFLNQIIMRVHLLGWRGKFQFEESWVCLLSALTPNVDIENSEPEEISAIMLANSLAIDGITQLMISTLGSKSSSSNQKYFHIPRHSNEKLFTLKYWKRLAHMNDKMCSKLRKMNGDLGLRLIRIDQRSNIDRPNAFQSYGFSQISVAYLQSKIRPVDEEESSETNLDVSRAASLLKQTEKPSILENVIDIRSCVQFVVDLFSQWILPNSGVTLNLQQSMVKSMLGISDLFTDRTHFEWMLGVFLELSKGLSPEDDLLHQYLLIGIAKASAVLCNFEGDIGEKIIKMFESSLSSSSQPMRQAAFHGLLYLLQALLKVEKPAEEVDSVKLSMYDFRQKIFQLCYDAIETDLENIKSSLGNASLLTISLTFYLLENYQLEVTNAQSVIKSLIGLAKHIGNGEIYLSILHGFERLILLKNYNLNDQITRLALERFSSSDPNSTIPALQLLLACIYADLKDKDGDGESEPWTLEIMEKITSMFDKIKKGYPVEVEIVCDILPGILSDFFSASDILTKVLGEFLSPNQPHKRNMAGIVFQVFSQAFDEEQLPLLQDWVVYSLNNLANNLPLMVAGWSLCCFFISASVNPWLKAIFPLVQSRIRQCEYEDRKILCLAAVDFYSQLTTKQKEIFLKSLQGASSSSLNSPFADIIASL